MHDRTSLQQLSSEQKDELILALQAHIGKQQKQSDELLQMVAALQARLNMNSRNFQQTTLQRWPEQAISQVVTCYGPEANRRTKGSPRQHTEPDARARR